MAQLLWAWQQRLAEEVLVAMATQDRPSGDADKPLVVRRGRVESVDLYEIKESELDLLERGSPAALQLNFAIFLLSLAFSAICALATATFASPKVANAFLFTSIVGILLGSYLLIAWYRSYRSSSSVCARIRGRISLDTARSPEPAPDAPADDKTPAG
jgi:hypothetical protein